MLANDTYRLLGKTSLALGILEDIKSALMRPHSPYTINVESYENAIDTALIHLLDQPFFSVVKGEVVE